MEFSRAGEGPKFLDPKFAVVAIACANTTLLGTALRDYLKLQEVGAIHMVVAVANADGNPIILHQETNGGNGKPFKKPYPEIARSKALQLWFGKNGGHGGSPSPHLLFAGDTPYHGGVKREGIVVACSADGLKPWVEVFISGMVADMLIALAHQAWVESEDYTEKRSFLT